MKLLNIIYTYNRPKAQFAFWDSLNDCTDVKADHTVVIDDGSDKQVQSWLYSFCSEKGYELLLKPKNQGYARAWLDGWYLMKKYNPEYVFFLESDYIFRKNFMEECFAVFEALPDIWGINGFSHPDFKDRERVKEWFGRVTKEHFGSDIKSRDSVYRPFDLQTSLGKVECQYSTHTCGTFLLNWKRLNDAYIKDENPDYHHFIYFRKLLDDLIERACENGEYDKVINDGMITGGLAWYWDQIVNYDGSKNHASAFIDICDYPIGAHLSGDGVNGKGVPEGQSNVWNDRFPQNYKEFER